MTIKPQSISWVAFVIALGCAAGLAARPARQQPPMQQQAAPQPAQKLEWPRDFVVTAESARWSRTEKDDGRITFNDADPAHASLGVVKYVDNALLEHDKSYPRVLETRAEPNGVIYGYYDGVAVPPNSQFRAEVGFLKGAEGAEGVTFTVSVLTENGTMVTPVASVTSKYDTRTDVLTGDLLRFAGQTVTFRLETRAGTVPGAETVWTFGRIEPKGR